MKFVVTNIDSPKVKKKILSLYRARKISEFVLRRVMNGQGINALTAEIFVGEGLDVAPADMEAKEDE